MQNQRRKCFLHIGTEKTGTTTLQAFLDMNRGPLREHGVLFTESAGKRNNRQVVTAALDPDKRDDASESSKSLTGSEFLKLQREIVSKLAVEIEASKLPTAVFSSEHFQSRLARPSEITRLKAILNDLGFNDISVIIYLRRPADIGTSLYSTAVRAGSVAMHPAEPSQSYLYRLCHHENTLKNWGAVFGRDNLVPRLFIREELAGSHIVDDFLGVLSLPKGAFQLPEDKNEALSALGIDVLRRLNNSIPAMIDGKRNPLRHNLVSYVERHLSRPKYRMPQELVLKYDRAFAESDEWVRQNFFPHRDKLFPARVEEVLPEPNPRTLDAEEQPIVDMIANIWLDKQRRIRAMEKRDVHHNCRG